MTIQTNAGSRRLSKLEALVQSQLYQALEGDPRAVEQIIRLDAANPGNSGHG